MPHGREVSVHDRKSNNRTGGETDTSLFPPLYCMQALCLKIGVAVTPLIPALHYKSITNSKSPSLWLHDFLGEHLGTNYSTFLSDHIPKASLLILIHKFLGSNMCLWRQGTQTVWNHNTITLTRDSHITPGHCQWSLADPALKPVLALCIVPL